MICYIKYWSYQIHRNTLLSIFIHSWNCLIIVQYNLPWFDIIYLKIILFSLLLNGLTNIQIINFIINEILTHYVTIGLVTMDIS